MGALVTFYALSEADTTLDAKDEAPDLAAQKVASQVKQAADLVSQAAQKRTRITILCADQTQAEDIDEFIWQYPHDAFVPHNLHGEGPAAGTPVEIVWFSAYVALASANQRLRNRAMLVNLSAEFIDDHSQFKHIIDFVPTQEAQKEAARMRYKQYKQAGCQLEYKSA